MVRAFCSQITGAFSREASIIFIWARYNSAGDDEFYLALKRMDKCHSNSETEVPLVRRHKTDQTDLGIFHSRDTHATTQSTDTEKSLPVIVVGGHQRQATL